MCFVCPIFCRQRRECDILKEENRRLKQEQVNADNENQQMRTDIERLEKRTEKLRRYENEYSVLQEKNLTLTRETEAIHQKFELVLSEKEELESQTKQAVQAMYEEREAKSILETKIQEEIHSPPHPSWSMEKENFHSSISPKNHIGPSSDNLLSPILREATVLPNLQSTPFSPKTVPSLLSELQSSFIGNVDSTELESLQQRCKEAENTITSLQMEKVALEEQIASSSLEKTETMTRIDSVKEEYAKGFSERDAVIATLKEEILIKDEAVGRHRTRLNSLSSEKASKEIEIDGLKDELQHVKQSFAEEMVKIQNDLEEEQGKNYELRKESSVLEEQLVSFSNTVERLEDIIFKSQSELSTMTDDLQNMHKAVVSLGVDNRRSDRKSSDRQLSPLSQNNKDVSENPGLNGPSKDELESARDSLDPYYSIELIKRKTSIPVHTETQSLYAIVQLHDQLRSVRLPLEQFIKAILEKSLAHSSVKRAPSDPSSPTVLPVPSVKKTSLELEASISKWKAKLSHKTEEINNLRAIMKARSTTADVAISSLRSKLEGQARAHQTELTRLKHQLKIMRKERDEQLSLRAVYAKRCEDHVDEITKMKRDIESKNIDYDDVMSLLKKTIHRKLELATELEEYRVEQERLHLIPKLLGSSRI